MSYAGIIAALITSISWSIGIFPFTEASKRMGANTVNHFRLLLAALILGLILILGIGNNLFNLFSYPTVSQWLWLGISGLVGLSLGDYFGFSAFVILGSGTGSLFTTIAPGAALVLGYFIMGETLNMTGLLGMCITMIGIVLISLRKDTLNFKEKQSGSIRVGILYAIAAACCQGIGLVFAKKGMSLEQHLHPMHAAWMRMVAGAGGAYLFSFIAGKIKNINNAVVENKNGGMKYLLAGTLFGPVIGVSMSLYTVSLIEVSVAQTIFSLVPVFVLLIGWIYFKNKPDTKSLLALTLCMIGVMILIWRNKIGL